MTSEKQTAPSERRDRKGLMLCCMRTAERYGDSRRRSQIPAGTTIKCEKCGQEIESLGGQAWKAK